MITRYSDESLECFTYRLGVIKESEGYTWSEIADIFEKNTNIHLSDEAMRSRVRRVKSLFGENALMTDDTSELDDRDEVIDQLNEIKKERYKFRDELNYNNSLLRRVAREESIKEIAHDIAETIDLRFPMMSKKPHNYKGKTTSAILEIGDWHYGMECNSIWNIYNPKICQERVSKLSDKVIEKIKSEGLTDLYVVNLGDLVSGRIHGQIRLSNRIDVITQIIEVSELLAQLLNSLSEYATIHYYDTLDNHSRIEPNKDESLQLESLARITTWYLKERFKNNYNININDNLYSDDIITFRIGNKNIGGVHGDSDKPNKVIQNITLMTQQNYDLICTAHLHHFQINEENDVLVVMNPSLMGTDSYAQKLRKTSLPAQNLILVPEEGPIETIYRLTLT